MILLKEPQNLHKHTSYSNAYTPDSTLLPVAYFEELKNRFGTEKCVYSCMEHGFQGDIFQTKYDLDDFNKKNKTNIKFVFSVEAYWVKDRFSQDKTNCHILLMAKNDNGKRKLTKAISMANIEGYYGKPRFDLELLLSLPKDDIAVTTACIAYWKYDDIEDITLKLNNHFTDFFLEVQYHNTEEQREINKNIARISRENNIPLIIGYDTHYITDSQRVDRDDLLRSHGISYEDEDGWFMDYPKVEETIKRVKWHNIFTEEEIEAMLDNTNIALDFEEITFDKSFKVPIPKQYRHLTQEQRNEELRKIVRHEWLKTKHAGDYNKSKEKQYLDEIKDSLDQIEGCGMSDYFLLNYHVIKLGIEKYGGELTLTGRGSAVSMYLNKLLGFTNVDAIDSPVEMFPSRFLTKERVLESHQMVDIDFNVSSREPFMMAQKELLGEKCAYDMFAIGKLKPKSAFKMYARAENLEPEIANNITKQLDKYEKAVLYADDEDKDDIDIFDFVSEEYRYLIENSKHYLGIVESKKVHACASLLLDGDIREEVGVIRVKSDKNTGNDTLVALITSAQIDNYGYLKNDLLVVSVIGIIYDVYREVGIRPLSIRQIIEETTKDKSAWDLYRNGYCVSLNQCEQPKTIQKVMKYKPQSPSELCQFVAGIRPSFMSMYKIFESRQNFEYGVGVLDKLLQDEYRKSSFLIYQEDTMKVLSFAGFNIGETYTLIKAISKKKDYVFAEVKPKFLKSFARAIIEDGETTDENVAMENSEKVWKIIEDSAKYGFNASHSYCVSLDSLQGAYLKAKYPLEFYKCILDRYTKKGDKNKITTIKKEMSSLGVKLKEVKFGDDNRTFSIDRENNCIIQTFASVKGMSKIAPEVLYEMRNTPIFEVLDLFVALDLSPLKKNDVKYLIKLDYFSSYGEINYLLTLWDKFCERFKKAHIEKTKIKRLDELKEYSRTIDSTTTDMDKLRYQVEVLGYTDKIDKSFGDYAYVVENAELNQWKTPFAELYHVSTGDRLQVKLNKQWFNEYPIDGGCVIETIIKQKNKRKKNAEGKWVESDEIENVIDVYEII